MTLLLLIPLLSTNLFADSIQTVEEGYFQSNKAKADQIIQKCGYKKDEIYALYVASLDSIHEIKGDLREEFNSILSIEIRKADDNFCQQVQTLSQSILKKYKATLQSTSS